jgi:hypothetical protein
MLENIGMVSDKQLTWIGIIFRGQSGLLPQGSEIIYVLALLENGIDLAPVQCASLGWFRTLADTSCYKHPKGIPVFITAILAWRIAGDTRSLAASGTVEKGIDVIVATHRFVSGKRLSWNLALRADESVKKLFCIFLVNSNARAMVPILATTFAKNHHAMIVRATTGTVFPSIIAFVAGRGTVLGARGLARMTRAGWGSSFGLCK